VKVITKFRSFNGGGRGLKVRETWNKMGFVTSRSEQSRGVVYFSVGASALEKFASAPLFFFLDVAVIRIDMVEFPPLCASARI